MNKIKPVEFAIYGAFNVGFTYCMLIVWHYLKTLPPQLLYMWYATVILSCLSLVGRCIYLECKSRIAKKGDNEIVFDSGLNKQITITGYDWRNSILNWTINGKKPIYHVSFELFRFKISWQHFGSI